MSAPKTNIEKQKRRHLVPLIGMALVAAFGVVLIVYWQFEEAAMGNAPATEGPAELPETPVAPDVIDPGLQPPIDSPQAPIAPAPAPQGD